MLTRDGVRLDADVYRPTTRAECPVLLMRQPYGRKIASTVTYAHPSWYAARGYLVVIQDVRGRGTSEGDFIPFVHEREDGYDSVEWAAQLPGANGRVGMYGFSYQGMTQLYAAAAQPPSLRAVCPAMIGYDLERDWAYEGGAFRLQRNLAWAVQLGAEAARRKGDEDSFLSFARAAKSLPLMEASPPMPAALQRHLSSSQYHEWIDRELDQEYWDKLSPRHQLAGTDLPMFHIGGWYDSFLSGTLSCYRALAERCRSPQQLLIGPWSHLAWGRRVGDLDFGAQALSPVDQLQLDWFDHFLAERTDPPHRESTVRFFELGSNRWRAFTGWPRSSSTRLYLGSSGLAGMRSDEGRLDPAAPSSDCEDVFVHDPWRPVPSIGGHAGFGAGPVERSAIDERSDVLVYTTQPFAADTSFAGEVEAHLWSTADTQSFDLCVVLSEVLSDGRVYPITQGHLRVRKHQGVQCHVVQMRAMSARIVSGNALRLSVSAANFPAHDINPGTGATLAQSRLAHQQVITVRVLGGAGHPSHVRLPLLDQRST